MPLGTSHRWAMGLSAAVLAAAVGPAFSQINQADPAQPEAARPIRPAAVSTIPDQLIAKLDSPRAVEREIATKEIAGGRYSMGAIETALARTDLSLEQRARLRVAARPIFERSPRAAIGVTFIYRDIRDDPEQLGTAIRPERGFDAFNILKEGDVIRSLDGRRVQGQADVRHSILSREPGEVVTLGLTREGNPLEVRLRLGDRVSFNESPGRDSRVPEEDMAAAWMMRAERLGGNSPALEASLPVDRWASREIDLPNAGGVDQPLVDPLTSEPIRSILPRPQVPEVAMGGETRVPSDGFQTADSGRLIFNAPGQPRVTVRLQPLDDRADNMSRQIMQQVGLLTKELNDLSGLLRNNDDKLKDPKHDASVRQLLLNERMVLQNQIRMLEGRIEALRRMAGVVVP